MAQDSLGMVEQLPRTSGRDQLAYRTSGSVRGFTSANFGCRSLNKREEISVSFNCSFAPVTLVIAFKDVQRNCCWLLRGVSASVSPRGLPRPLLSIANSRRVSSAEAYGLSCGEPAPVSAGTGCSPARD